nr:hypothetical protein [Stenoxybacter acetivorans]
MNIKTYCLLAVLLGLSACMYYPYSERSAVVYPDYSVNISGGSGNGYWQTDTYYPTYIRPVRPNRPIIVRPRPGNHHNFHRPNRPNIDRPNIDRPNIDRPNIDRPNIDRPNIDRPNIDRPNIDRPNIDRPNIDRPNMNTRPGNNRPYFKQPNQPPRFSAPRQPRRK